VKIYLGGPINGCTDAEATGWRETAKATIKEAGHEYIDPMDRDYRGQEMEPGIATKIVESDKEDIKAADVVILNCPKPSVGTSMEMYYAWSLGKPEVFAVIPENKPPSPWLVYHSDAQFHSVAAALEHVL
jgi:nucleoside 2-deoxyribosyltransferase